MNKPLCMLGAISSVLLEEMLPVYMRSFMRRLIKPSEPYLTRRLKRKTPIMEATPDFSIELPLEERKPVHLYELEVSEDGYTKGKYFIEEHAASHLHHDFSIILNGKVYRVARTPAESNKKLGFLGIFPGPKEKVQWVLQPEHLIKEVPNPPVIKDGYGKGTTKVLKEGYCFANMSPSGNLHVMFEGIEGTYVFIEKDSSVLIIKKHHPGPSLGKHIMKESTDISSYINNNKHFFFAKKNGSGIEWKIVDTIFGKRLQVWSWRQDALAKKKYGVNQQIEHTFRLKLCDQPIPDSIPTSSGRGELWCNGIDGLHHIGSLLNSGQARARTLPWKPYLYIHDILTWDNKDVSNASYREKLTLMEHMHKNDLRFKIPEYASTPKGKKNLWDKCHKEWPAVDGVISWDMDAPGETIEGRGVKLKFKHLSDNWHPGTIVDIVPQRGEHGEKFGFPIVENKWGSQFKSSGVGITEQVKADMLKNPDDWIGVSVRYSAERHFDNGTPFQPIIKDIACE